MHKLENANLSMKNENDALKIEMAQLQSKIQEFCTF